MTKKMILNDISSLIDTKKQLIFRLTEDLNKIENIQAIALGGSHATGRANESSDIDLGIYYYEQAPFSIEMVKEITRKYATNGDSVVVGFYEWGSWVKWWSLDIYRNRKSRYSISRYKPGREYHC